MSLVTARNPPDPRDLGSFKIRRCAGCGRLIRIPLSRCNCTRCNDLRGEELKEGPYVDGTGPYCDRCRREGNLTSELPEVAVAVCFLTDRRNHHVLYRAAECLERVARALRGERRFVAVGTPVDDLYFNLRCGMEAGIDFGIRAQMSSIFTHMDPDYLVIAHNPVRRLRGRPRERFKYTLRRHAPDLRRVVVLEDVVRNEDFARTYRELGREFPDAFEFLRSDETGDLIELLRE
ncbi:MAG: hypothetical protein ABGY09_04075 [Euryarchaeota archaeon]